MPSSDSILTDFRDFDSIVAGLKLGTLYRGVADADRHELVPRVGRYLGGRVTASRKEALLRAESNSLRVFGAEAVRFFGRPFASKWEKLAYAQHHGLPTRLLDWSLNPLVALYFACDPSHTADGAVYSCLVESWIDGDGEADHDPFTVTEPHVFMPAHVSARISAQRGVFTVQPDPFVPFDAPDMLRIRIPQALKRSMRKHLLRYDVSARSLFPDVDGLAASIRSSHFGE